METLCAAFATLLCVCRQGEELGFHQSGSGADRPPSPSCLTVPVAPSFLPARPGMGVRLSFSLADEKPKSAVRVPSPTATRGAPRVHPEQRPKRTGPPAGNPRLLGCSSCRGFLNPAQASPAAPGGALDASSPGSHPHTCSPLLGPRVAVCCCLILPAILGPGQMFSLILCFFFDSDPP